MATFEVQGADGKTYEVVAPNMEAAAAAIKSVTVAPAGGLKESGLNPTATIANFANAMAFGQGDEFLGFKAGLGSMLSGGDYLPAYQAERDSVRGNMALINEKYPGSALLGGVGGAMVPALASAPLGIGKTALETVFRGMGLGAVEGGLQGSGNADGRDMLKETATGVIAGGLIGAAAPMVVGGLGMIKNAIKDPLTGSLDALLGRANAVKSNRVIADLLRGSKKTEGDIVAEIAAAQRAGQPEFTLMDVLGVPGQRKASALTRRGGDSGTEIADFLSSRQSGQGDRVGAFVEDAFGAGGTTAAKTEDALVVARRKAANEGYKAASAGAKPVDVRPAVAHLDETISKMSGSGLVPPKIVTEFKKIRAKLAGKSPKREPTTLSDYDSVLALWKEVKDDIDKAFNSGDGSLGEALKPIRDSLEGSLSESSDLFRATNAEYRASSKVIKAVKEGGVMATSGRDADNIPQFGAMTAEEQRAARVGYGDVLLRKLRDVTAPATNRAKDDQLPWWVYLGMITAPLTALMGIMLLT